MSTSPAPRSTCRSPEATGSTSTSGRGRPGKVAPRDRDRVTAEVVDLLGGLRGPTGDPVFQAVLPSAEAYPGQQRGRAPTCSRCPRTSPSCRSPTSPATCGRPARRRACTGTRGSGRSARRGCARPHPGTVPLVDALPTLLMDLGASWPSDIDGSPRTEIFTEDLPVPALDPR
ncbi:hypothetical protein ACR6C2_30030 [Streptomyces sp. INA 01156]